MIVLCCFYEALVPYKGVPFLIFVLKCRSEIPARLHCCSLLAKGISPAWEDSSAHMTLLVDYLMDYLVTLCAKFKRLQVAAATCQA